MEHSADSALTDAHFRALFEHAPLPAYVWQAADAGDFLLLACNAAARQAFPGLPRPAPGASARWLYADIPEILAGLARCQTEQRPVHTALDYRPRGGTKLRLALDYVFLAPRCVLMYARFSNPAPGDAADLEALFKTGVTGLFLANAQGRLVRVNRKCADMLGYPARALVGLNYTAVIQSIGPRLNRLLEKVEWLIARQTGQARLKKTFVRRDGSSFRGELWLVPLPGELNLGVLLDLDAYLRLEENLAHERYFADTLFDAVETLLLVLDRDGRILRFNRACEALTGYRAAQVRGRHLWELFDNTEVAGLLQALFKHPPPGKPSRAYENYWLDRDGQVRHISWSEHLVYNAAGKLAYVLSAGIDVTAHRRSEAALAESNRALGRQVEDMSQYMLEIQLLNNMGKLLQGCLSTQEAYVLVPQFMESFFPATVGALDVVGQLPHGALLRAAVWGGAAATHLPPSFAEADCAALRKREPHYVADTAAPEAELCRHLPQPPPPAYVCVPLIAQNEVLGVLHIAQNQADADSLDPIRRQLAERVAEHIAISLLNLRLREVLHEQSIHDPLTGLFNRRYLEWALAQEIQRAKRRHAILGVIMLDLDHFKRFNDNYGHAAGDKVLQSLGVFLQQRVRTGDIVCRYGGEEFTLIVPDIGTQELYHLAERLRQAAKQIEVRYHDGVLPALSLSLGVAIFPRHGPGAEELLHAADSALYRAKEQGRDRVVIAD